MDRAVSAFSLIRDTYTLSMKLYRACTSMESITGNDIVMMSLPTGIAPILFLSVALFSLISAVACVISSAPRMIMEEKLINIKT